MTHAPIDFAHVSRLDWTGATSVFAGNRSRIKQLRGDASGGMTAVVDIAPGGKLSGRSGDLVSFVVLGGVCEVAGRTHGHLGFGQVCTDEATTWTTPAGARLFVFQQPGEQYDPSTLAASVDTLDAEWEVAGEDVTGGMWRELTFTPPSNPAGAIVLRSLAVGDAPVATHRHDWDEEVLVIDGERLTPAGAMTAGAYAWRPRGSWHGGFRTGSPGALLLLRRIGEPHALDGSPQPRFDPVAAERIRRPARLLPAAAATVELMGQRAILTGRLE